MPRAVIPQYQPNRVQTQPLGVQEVTANTSPARAVAQLAGNLGAFAEQKLVEHDETTVRDAVTAWEKRSLEIQYGPDGIVGRQGKDYIDNLPKAMQAFDELDSSTLGVAQNARQQKMLRDQIEARRLQSNSVLQRIETNERTKWEEASAFGKVSSSAQMAAMTPDVTDRNNHIMAGRSQLFVMAQKAGFGGPESDAAQAYVRQHMTPFHNTVLAGFRERKDYAGAIAYIDVNSRDFDRPVAAKAKEEYGQLQDFDDGYKLGNDLYVLSLEQPDLDIEAAIAKLPPGKAKTASEQYQRRLAIGRRDEQDRAVEVKNRLETKKARGEEFTPEDRLDAEKYGFADELAAWEIAPVANDSPAYQAARAMPPEEFAKLTRQNIIDLKVSPDDRVKLLDRFDNGKKLASDAHISAVSDVTSMSMAYIKADGKKRSGPELAKIDARVRTMVAVEVAAFIDVNKTPPGPADRKAIVARVINDPDKDQDYFGASDEGQLYVKNRDRYGKALSALTPPGGKVDPKAKVKPDREWAATIVRNMDEGRPALPFKQIPDHFKAAMARNFITMTPAQMEEAFSAYINGENLDQRYAGMSRTRAGLAGAPGDRDRAAAEKRAGVLKGSQ